MHTIFFERLYKIISQYNIISIIGESSTGKTTLALQLISNLMKNNDIANDQIRSIWVQASEEFPKKRLISMYQMHPNIVSMLLKNIFVIPKDSPFSNMASQSKFLRDFKNLLFPPGIKYIVIDNISHHHRLAQANFLNFQKKMKFMNEFFNHQLYPLIMLSLREHYHLFFIHEVSFDPQTGKLKAYNNQLFERVKGIEIFLSKKIGSQLKSMKIFATGINDQCTYEISDQGLIIL